VELKKYIANFDQAKAPPERGLVRSTEFDNGSI